jgi:hypothetical protein
MTTIIAGCASAPTDNESEKQATDAVDVDQTVRDGGVAYKDYLSGVDPDSVNRCRKETQTGTYIKRTVCGPKRDDRGLLTVITSPPH